MKEFWTYTALRAGLFLATLLVTFGIWALVAGQVPVVWAAIIAFLVSGVLSFFLLNRSREAFAQRVQRRADRATAAFEAQRSKEDTD